MSRYITSLVILLLIWSPQEIWLIDLELAGPNYRGFDLMKLFRTKPELFSVSLCFHDVVYQVKVLQGGIIQIFHVLLCRKWYHVFENSISFLIMCYLEPHTTVNELILECRTCEALTWLEVRSSTYGTARRLTCSRRPSFLHWCWVHKSVSRYPIVFSRNPRQVLQETVRVMQNCSRTGGTSTCLASISNNDASHKRTSGARSYDRMSLYSLSHIVVLLRD